MPKPALPFADVGHHDMWAKASPSPDCGGQRHLDSLPDELKLHILQHTGPNPFALAAMQRVSRSWRVLAQDDALWEPLYPRRLVTRWGERYGDVRLESPQARLAAHMRRSDALRHLYFRELWAKRIQPASLMIASKDAVFACHAGVCLGSGWPIRRDRHPEAQARRRALYMGSMWLAMTAQATNGVMSA